MSDQLRTAADLGATFTRAEAATRGLGKTCACGHSMTRHQFCGRSCDAVGCHDCVCDIRAFEVDQGCLHYSPSDPLFLKVSLADRVEELRRTNAPAPTVTCPGVPDVVAVR